jgi:hypothetical protein
MEEDKARNWNFLCLESIRKEKAEVAKRYGIIFGQTNIYCARCKRPMPLDFKQHTCENTRLKALREEKNPKKRGLEAPKRDVSLSLDDFKEIMPFNAM